jgi:RNA polymerase sigma factor (sigma-70 family)
MRRPFGGASFRFSEECLEPFVVRQHRIVMAELAVDPNVTVNQIGEPVTPSKPSAADSSTADSSTASPSALSTSLEESDHANFNTLYAQYWPSLNRLATVMTGNPQEGQDLAQEAFARWYVHRGSVQNDEAYLRITLINLIRGGGRTNARLRRFMPMLEREAQDMQNVTQPINELADVLRKLPERQRTAIVLKYYDGRTEQEIATLIGCRPGTVKSLLSRALHELRRVIEPLE